MSKDPELFDNKLIVLYILDNANQSLTITQIVKFCEDFDDITYFDICAYIDILKRTEYISEYHENSNTLYSLTELGKSTLKELLELVPGVNLYNLKKMVSKNAAQVKTEHAINTKIIPLKSDDFKVSCYIKDGHDELVNISIYATTKEQAKNISKNWSENAEEIYSTLLEMITK